MSSQNVIRAPWSETEVAALNKFQEGAPWHPFTCPFRDSDHEATPGRDPDVLEATVHGWRCPKCGYRQDWAWGFMAELEWWGGS